MEEEQVTGDSLSAAERSRLIAENNRLRHELQERYGFSNIVGNSRAMRLVCQQIGQIARASADVLIRGEPGTGKTLIARAIHHNSSRSRQPFIKLRCGGLPDGVAHAQLFGEAKSTLGGGAPATGSLQRAGGGTLFLEEIGGLGLEPQERLLTTVRDRGFERPAGRHIRLDVRLIAATSARLEEGVTNGSFRRDLYQRLSRLTIAVPPLRERKADLPILIDLFVEKFAREHVRRVGGFSMRAMDMLVAYRLAGKRSRAERGGRARCRVGLGAGHAPSHAACHDSGRCPSGRLAPPRTRGGARCVRERALAGRPETDTWDTIEGRAPVENHRACLQL